MNEFIYQTKENIFYLITNNSVGNISGTVIDLIQTLLIIFFAIIIFSTIAYLFLSILKIVKSKDDQEERATAVKHSIIIVVCLIIEIALIILISTLL